MNKPALKRFATSMRLELISLVKTKIDFLLSDAYKENLALYDTNKKSISQIAERYTKDKEDFIEEIAYTWFNRLVALRFMDVNEITFAPIISTTPEQPIPQSFINAKSGTIEDDLNLNKERFFDLIDKKVSGVKDGDNEAYKMLFISTCNHYAKLMPTMFERISDYTELLLPEDMLSPNSLRAQVVTSMDAEDCKDIEVIGWLYQFYISEKKDDVFAQLKKNKKITPANIPASTQLFTPHWIVKYMVENSLGKIWMLNHPNSSLKESMKYYIDNTEESTTFIKISTPQELTFLDPCCGSGHTLTYAFDLLTLIYEEEGYNKSDIPSLILEHNLFGCDIDKRASVLANFALTMKARQYYKRFFNKDVKPNIVELEDYGSEEFAGIKNFGSLMVPHAKSSFDDGIFSQNVREYELQKKILSSEFHCVVTNPPYMGGKGMNAELSDFVKKQYPDSKSDLMTCFMERCLDLTRKDGYSAMINIPSWMFLSSFENMRKQLVGNFYITSLLHLGRGIFGSDFGTVAYVMQKRKPNDSIGIYRRLFTTQGSVDNVEQKEKWFIDKSFGWYKESQQNFSKIPGSPIAYWANGHVCDLFLNESSSKYLHVCAGLTTGNTDLFLKYWYEVPYGKISFKIESLPTESTFIPYDKGGEFRKWYGNLDYVLWYFSNSFKEMNKQKGYRGDGLNYFFKPSITWSKVTISYFSARYSPASNGFDATASSAFGNENDLKIIMLLLNSKVGYYLLNILNSTMVYLPRDIKNIPIMFSPSSLKITHDCVFDLLVSISKKEWDSRETSWDFKTNELIKHKSDGKIESAYDAYCNYWREQHNTLHQNEEELNRLFIDIYKLQDKLTPEVELKYITILKNETKIVDGELIFQADEIIKQFISYGVGVMFGRYSLNNDGLVVANMNQEIPTDTTFEIDDDNVIPVLEDDYFKDDIASRFVQFVKATFGEENLSENIRFIESSLGTTIRKYFVKGFFDDHVKRYKKRPIYWMVASPKKGFMSLIYMHRYQSDIFARVRNSYLSEYITKLEAHKDTLHLTTTSDTASDKDKKDADKRIKEIETKLKELIAFDRDTMMSFSQNNVDIDLDDGVKVNYSKFQEILYEIKGLNKDE